MVICLARLWDWDDGCALPGVMAPENRGIEQQGQASWGGSMIPFKEFVHDPSWARGRPVRSGCQVAGYFLLGNGCEWASWDWGGVKVH